MNSYRDYQALISDPKKCYKDTGDIGSNNMTITDNQLFESLGFSWNRGVMPKALPIHPVENVVARYRQMLPTFVWDAGVLENNPLTYIEVKTLLDGVTVGGHKISDQDEILNLAESSKLLLHMVRKNEFAFDKKTFTALHKIVAREQALEWGNFRGEGKEMVTPNVDLGDTKHTPLSTELGAANLNRVFEQGIANLSSPSVSTFERAAGFFLFGALQQFFFDGNKRASRHMMNGVLMSSGHDAISIPAAKVQEFNERLNSFYRFKDGTEMMKFVAGCSPTNGTAAQPKAGIEP